MALSDLIGYSAKFRALLEDVNSVARVDSAVLLRGETGTGKELVARAIHDLSARRDHRFVPVNCAAIPGALLESELFGHERGAFTGAVNQTNGRFHAAHRGTLFLDEVGELPLELQPKLLRVLQEKQIERLGSGRIIDLDIRIIAATNQDLWQMVQERKFRADLYFRLNVFPIVLPPLRERRQDIPVLVDHLLEKYAAKAEKKIERVDKRSLDLLMSYEWPGNIRELQNVIERAMILAETETLFVEEKWLQSQSKVTCISNDAISVLAEKEVEIIEAALAESNGRVSGPSGAATKLRMPRQTLESKIKRLGLSKFERRIHLPPADRPLQAEAASA